MDLPQEMLQLDTKLKVAGGPEEPDDSDDDDDEDGEKEREAKDKERRDRERELNEKEKVKDSSKKEGDADPEPIHVVRAMIAQGVKYRSNRRAREAIEAGDWEDAVSSNLTHFFIDFFFRGYPEPSS